MRPNRNARVVRGAAVWIALAAAAVAADEAKPPASASAPTPPTTIDQWRNDNACGVNCVYVLMKLHNLDVGYDALFHRLLDGGKETSLLDLQRVVNAYGLKYEGGRSTPEGLQKARKAVVCHTENPITGKGHFILVLRADAEGVVAMDGTTCVLRRYDWSTFRSTWSGYVLFPRESRSRLTGELATFAVGFGATWGCLAFAPRLRRRAH